MAISYVSSAATLFPSGSGAPTATSWTYTVTAPSGMADGDVLFLLASNPIPAALPSLAVPAGWFYVGGVGGAFLYLTAVTGTPPAAVTVVSSGANAGFWAFVTAAWRGVVGDRSAVARSLYAPSVTATTSDDWMVTFYAAQQLAGTPVPSCSSPSGQPVVNRAGHNFGTFGNGVTSMAIAFADTGSTVAQGATPANGWMWTPASAGPNWGVLSVTISGAKAPNAPTLQTPPNGAYVEFGTVVYTETYGDTYGQYSGSPTFAGVYNNTDGSICAAYQWRVKPVGGSYQYWDAATNALVGSPVWNPGTCTFVLPAGTLSDDTTYNWSFNTQSSFDSAYTSGFAADFVVNGQSAPTVTVTGPTGEQTTPTVTVTWTSTTDPLATLTSWRVVTYLEAATLVAGFEPGVTSGAVDDSGVVIGSAASYQTGVLPNEASLVSYVQLGETGAQISEWNSSSFSTLYGQPAAVGLAAASTVDLGGVPCVAVTVTGYTVGYSLTITYTDASNPTPVPVRLANAITIPSGPGVTDMESGAEFDDGSTWDDSGTFDSVSVAAGYIVNDYEAIPAVPRTYTAVQTSVPMEANGYQQVPSLPSPPSAATLAVSSWWLIEPLAPDTDSVPLNVLDNPVLRYANLATHYPLAPASTIASPSTPVVVSGGIAGQDGSVVVQTTSQAAFAALESASGSGTVKWLMSPYGWGVYCRVGTANPLSGMSGLVHQTAITPSPAANPVRNATMQYTEQARP